MHHILLARRIICAVLLSFITVQSAAHETPAQYELQQITLPEIIHPLAEPSHQLPNAAMGLLSTLATYSTISCGPVSCSVPAIVGVAYYVYQWWKHRKCAQPANLAELTHDTQQSSITDADSNSTQRSPHEHVQQLVHKHSKKVYAVYTICWAKVCVKAPVA